MNKNKIEAIIFDMDGTLYQFDQRDESHFSSSQFGQTIHENCIRFFQNTLKLSRKGALQKYQDFRNRYNDEISLGVEKELGIDRKKYFDATWDLDPAEFMAQSELLIVTLSSLQIKTGVLSAAPSIWVNRVLEFLQIKQLFEPHIINGEPDLRKPDPEAFGQFSQLWGIPPQAILAIGDQELTDIIPAKKAGMLTARIGKNVETQADFVSPDIITMIAFLKKENIL